MVYTLKLSVCLHDKNAVGRYKSSFRGYEQQDSHEFLTILVDWLHEELNEVLIILICLMTRNR
jgi:ubiquitin C-terminal hydrolase